MSIAELYRAVASTGAVQPQSPSNSGSKTPGSHAKGPSDFQKVLEGEHAKQSLNFSQHAEARIKSRQIPWDAALEDRIKNGLDAAQSKGSRDALILADNVAVIANVKSRTIVTAMDREQLKERIFTNIDSAVLV